MSVYKCKMCGQETTENGVWTCTACSCKQVMPKFGDAAHIEPFYNAVKLRQNGELESAEQLLKKLIGKGERHIALYWEVLLCKYGIVYEKDAQSGEWKPTCRRSTSQAISTDALANLIMQGADAQEKIWYEQEMRKIESACGVQATKGDASTAQMTPLLERAFDFLAQQEWRSAYNCCEKEMTQNPQNAYVYLGILMARLHVSSIDELAEQDEAFDTTPEYKKAYYFADAELKAKLDTCASSARGSAEQAQMDQNYQRAAELLFGSSAPKMSAPASQRPSQSRPSQSAPSRPTASSDSRPSSMPHPTASQAPVSAVDKQNFYARADEMLKSASKDEDYLNAAKIFNHIKGYQDADQKAKTCLYRYALSLKEKGTVDSLREAAKTLSAISDYENAAEEMEKCKKLFESEKLYSAAMGLMKSAKTQTDFESACDAFKRVGAYKDAKDRAEQCQTQAAECAKKEDERKERVYQHAAKLQETKKVKPQKEAGRLFATLGAFRDAEKRQAECRAFVKKKHKKTAIISSGSAVLAIAAVLLTIFLIIPLVRFNNADKLLDDMNYDQALEIYEALGSFGDSEQRVAVIYAIKDLEAKKFHDAIQDILDAGVPVKVEYGMGGGDFSGQAHIEAKPSGGSTTALGFHKMESTALAGSESAPANMSFTYEAETQFEGMKTPGRNGYRFVEWKLESHSYHYDGDEDTLFEVSFTAVWSAKEYTIQYDLAGGTLDGSNPVEFGPEDASFTLLNPTRRGYTFMGWQEAKAKEPSTELTIEKGSYGNRVYTAVWKANTYTVTFDANGGTVSENTQTVTFDQLTELLVPERRGYRFMGWYDGDTRYEDGAWVTDKNVSVSARWEMITYQIEYTLDGGSVSVPNPSTFTVETNSFTLRNPSKTGYTFLGWTFEGQTTPLLEVTVEKGSIEDRTYVANWEANGYVVTFDPADGRVNPSSMVISYGSTFTLPVPTKTGYTFAGWYENSRKIENGTWQIARNVTLVAHWTANTYTVTFEETVHIPAAVTVTFDPNYSGAQITTETLSNGDTLEYPEIPTREGYVFAGWYTDSACTTQYNFSGTITEDITLYAGWVSPSYTHNGIVSVGSDFTVSLNGTTIRYYAFIPLVSGNITVYSTGSTDTCGYLYDANRTQLVYNDDGTSNNNFSYTYSVTAGNLYYIGVCAYHSGVTETVTVYVNGTALPTSTATAEVAQTESFLYSADSDYVTTVTFGEEWTLPVPTRTGYTFDGWYYGDERIEDGVWDIASDTTLSAHWTIAEYTITLDANGGNVTPSTLTTHYGEQITLPTPTRTGYTFGGWFNGTEEITNGEWLIDSSVTLTASWTVNTYEVTFEDMEHHLDEAIVTFDPNYSGAQTTTETLSNGDTLEYPEIPTRDGYVFAGWYTNSACTVPYDFTGTITEDMTLYAGWVSPSYSYNGIVSVGSNFTVSLNGTTTRYYAFIPLVSGNITVYSNGSYDTYGHLYDASRTLLRSDDDSGSGNNFSYTYSVTAGNLYYIGVRAYSSGTYGTVTVYVNGTALPTSWATAEVSGMEGDYYNADSDFVTSVTFGEELTLPVPQRTGYVFGGWYNVEQRVEDGAWSIDSDTVLTARWTAIDYTVTLDANGGSVSPSTITIHYGEELTLPTLTRTGYTFGGWFNGTEEVTSGTWLYTADMDLTASWTVNTYEVTFEDLEHHPEVTVTFDPNYSNAQPTTETLSNGDTLEHPEIPTRNGYVFAGWYTNSACTAQYDFTGTITEDMTLYARWVSPSYTYNGIVSVGSDFTVSLSGQNIRYYAFIPLVSGNITVYSTGSTDTCGYLYNANRTQLVYNDDGTSNNNFSYTYSVTAGNLYYIGVRAYSSSASATVPVYVNGTTLPTSQATAEFEAGDYYNADSDFVTSVTFGEELTLPVPQRTGYVFGGWYNGEQRVEDGAWAIDSDTVLTARWTVIDYTVTLDANGGSVSPSTLTAHYGEELTLPTLTRTGYTFGGWFNGTEEITSGTWLYTTDMDLTASWIANTYIVAYENIVPVMGSATVTFDPNYTDAQATTQTLYKDEALTYPDAPTREGYVFKGWYTDAACTNRYDFSGTLTTDLTLYAGWEAQPTENALSHTLIDPTQYTTSSSYYSLASSGTASNIQKMAYLVAQESGEHTIYIRNSRSGSSYSTYIGITNLTTGATIRETIVCSSTSFYGYTFSCNAGDVIRINVYRYSSSASAYIYFAGFGAPTCDLTADVPEIARYQYQVDEAVQSEMTFGEAYTLLTPVRTGYTFGGWYYNGQKMENGVWNIDADVTLTASWTQNEYTVTLDANGGSVESSTLTTHYGDEVTLPTPTRTGYTFGGWFNGTEEVTSGAWLIDSSVTLTASWTANTYTVTYVDVTPVYANVTVTFDLNYSGSESFERTLSYGDTLVYPEAPLRSGCVFVGWYTDAACTSLYDFVGTVTEDMTLYAGWVALTYTNNGTVSVGSNFMVSLNGTNVLYFGFVPLVSENITVYSTGSTDTYGYLYDANRTQIAYDDDTGSGNNFSYTYNVTAGTLYYIGVRAYSSSSRATVTVYLNGTALPTSQATVQPSRIEVLGYSADYDYVVPITFGETSTLPVPTREGYTFDGWYYGDQRVEDGAWAIASDATLTAHWTVTN